MSKSFAADTKAGVPVTGRQTDSDVATDSSSMSPEEEKPVRKDKIVSVLVRPCFRLEAQCATVTPKSVNRAWKPLR